jgi:hypothetical protein
MALTDYVDLYCERVAPGLWAEPLNALSNVAFLIAAGMLAAKLPRVRVAASIGSLPVLLLLVGLGSLAFHLVANVWTGWLDTGFILAFACAFFYAFFRHVAHASRPFSAAITFGFFWLSFGAKYWLPSLGLNGSEAYLPMLIGLIGMSAYVRRYPRMFGHFFVAALLFLVSVSLRTVDRAVCDALPMGTHFVWHLLNAVILYILTAAIIEKSVKEVNA